MAAGHRLFQRMSLTGQVSLCLPHCQAESHVKGVNYRHHMALQIEKVPLSSARKATKVLQLCLKFQLKEQGTHVPTLYVLISPPRPLSPTSPECVPCDVHERVPQWPTGGSSSVVPAGQRCRLCCISCREVSELMMDCGAVGTLSLPSQIFRQLPELGSVHGP